MELGLDKAPQIRGDHEGEERNRVKHVLLGALAPSSLDIMKNT